MDTLKKSVLFAVLLLSSMPIFCQDKELSSSQITLCLEDRNWALLTDIKDYILGQYKTGDHSLYVDGYSPSYQIAFSIFMEKAPKAGDSKTCRDVYWKKVRNSSIKTYDVKMWESGNMALVEYVVKGNGKRYTLDVKPMIDYMAKNFAELSWDENNLKAYIVKEDVWMDIHLSTFQYKDDRYKKLFNEIIQSFKFDDQYKPDINYFSAIGSKYYSLNKYKIAIAYDEMVLKLYKAGQTLDKDRGLTIIDNLGTAYNLSGDYMKSKETYEYGISQYETYPMFYYNLACAYANMNKLDSALVNLQKAYKYKKNILNGEEFPDPRTDVSFRKHFDNEQFKKAIEELN